VALAIDDELARIDAAGRGDIGSKVKKAVAAPEQTCHSKGLPAAIGRAYLAASALWFLLNFYASSRRLSRLKSASFCMILRPWSVSVGPQAATATGLWRGQKQV
jgi:hypothetical protein